MILLLFQLKWPKIAKTKGLGSFLNETNLNFRTKIQRLELDQVSNNGEDRQSCLDKSIPNLTQNTCKTQYSFFVLDDDAKLNSCLNLGFCD